MEGRDERKAQEKEMLRKKRGKRYRKKVLRLINI
jgi:hypothetical protein